MRLAATILALALVGCASKSADIEATYISPVAYNNLNCEQLGEEARVVSQRAQVASKRQDNNRKNDAVKTTVGLVLFWPVLLFNEGDGGDAAQLSALKGQMEAIETASRQKSCNITFQQ